jgi:hypothetical protein
MRQDCCTAYCEAGEMHERGSTHTRGGGWNCLRELVEGGGREGSICSLGDLGGEGGGCRRESPRFLSQQSGATPPKLKSCVFPRTVSTQYIDSS